MAFGLTILVFLALLGCRDVSSSASHLDLVDRFSNAGAIVPTRSIDFGDPNSRRHLVRGWSWDETYSKGTFAWGLGDSSSIWFEAWKPADISIVFRCWPFPFDNAPPQTMRILANGSLVDVIRLNDRPMEYRAILPSSLVRSGENELTFEYSYNVKSKVVGAGDGLRPLAVAWDYIRFGGQQELIEEPSADQAAKTLTLPIGGRVDYYLKLNRRAYLRIEKVLAAQGSQSATRLSVRLRSEDGSLIANTQVPTSELPQDIPMDVPDSQIVELSLAPADGALGAGGLELFRPTIFSPNSTSEDREVEETRQSGHSHPNVIIYVIDTLRADHLQVYGYNRPTSPQIGRFAEDSIVFDQAYAETAWTRPTVASLFTGLIPRSHGVNDRNDALADSAVTLAEELQQIGYETAALVTNGNVSAGFGFAQGFDVFRYSEDEKELRRRQDYADVEDWLIRGALEWVEQAPANRPFFLYLHAIDPHGPYEPRHGELQQLMGTVDEGALGLGSTETLGSLIAYERPASPLRSQLIDLYDAEIVKADRRFGELIEGLRQLARYEDSIIVLLADHGEEFFDHGWWTHGKTLYGEQLKIPLLIKLPNRLEGGSRRDVMARQVDIRATILELVGEDAKEGDGRSLVPWIWDASREGDERESTALLRLDQRTVESISVGAYKLIQYVAYDQPKPQFELYDLTADPKETEDLASERPVLVRYLASELRARRAASKPSLSASTPSINSQVEANLRALGYLQ